MEQDNSIPCLIEKTIHSLCDDIVDPPPSSWGPNTVEWWNEDASNRSIGGGMPWAKSEADEWNLDRFNERLGEASTAATLVWKELEISRSSKKLSVARLQDCCILDLDCDSALNERDTSHGDILPNPNVSEDLSESLSWPYDDSLFFAGSSKYSPCLWNSRKRRIAGPSSTAPTTDTTKEPTVALDPSATFHVDFNHPSKFHVWSQDPLDTSSSMHTRYVPTLPEATTPPPIRLRKRKKGWNATNQRVITETKPSHPKSSETPKIYLPAPEKYSSSLQTSSAPLPLKWLLNTRCNDADDNDDSSTETSLVPKKDNQECHTNRTTVAGFRQIIQQKEPITEADFMEKPNRSMFHRLMYEQTMGVSMAALKEHQKSEEEQSIP